MTYTSVDVGRMVLNFHICTLTLSSTKFPSPPRTTTTTHPP